jgi:tyrosyl-tRNA synthetase
MSLSFYSIIITKTSFWGNQVLYCFKMAETDEILTRRVEKILPSREGLAKLLKKQKIRLYQGFDPTGKLHIGHGIGLKLLMEFALAGHEVIFLFGTGTVLVGDPSQRQSARKLITEKEIAENIKSWKKQVAPIVDFSQIKIKQNGDWLTRLTLKDIVQIASNISATQLFKRESFQNRLKAGNTVWYHETMYPIFQGYDSVVLDVDLEIGGSDQEFNMLMGRELLKKIKGKDKYVLTLPLIMGTDGQKMSASRGNCIWMDDAPEQMHGKLMSVSDEQIIPYLKLCSDMDLKEISGIEKSMQSGANPREFKARMALEITKLYHGENMANKAATEFEALHKEGKQPGKMPEFKLSSAPKAISALLVATGLATSSSEAKRLITQGGVKINSQTVDTDNPYQPKRGDVIQVGKRRFVKIV